ncbi:MAG: type II toxin-antitoxin system RelE/ParE family toxin [Chitinispirillaceae bacterium]|nr:type II toxin-antitoxin system RelE/ParE family toxin [Chitinispirillaceae bacterium]
MTALERHPRPPGVKKLAGAENGYRVRVGDYRILYTIDDQRKIATIHKCTPFLEQRQHIRFSCGTYRYFRIFNS